ncbi:MAG: LysM peptidoglycan-binding domain-containing protein [Bacteroidales bacterium]|jgi:LysM repeat protein/ABC-type branched-subunit amino acid transport system substrate-binding protein|nr:LysM peptidoglycan-binding domain-containing protein [Bacteroidales bacterium]
MKNLLFISVFMFLCASAGSAMAQDNADLRSVVIEQVDGKNYYVHTVKPKETLYSIVRLYGVSARDIIIANPNADAEKLKAGQLLRIPVPENKPVEVRKQYESYTQHIVEPGETLYSLARMYGVTVRDILDANSGIDTNLAINQVVFIPCNNCKRLSELQNPPLKSDTQATTDSTSATEKKNAASEQQITPYSVFDANSGTKTGIAADRNMHVVLMLPLFLNKEKTDAPVSNKIEINPDSYPFLQYYEGALLALDSLKRLGISLTFTVFDTQKDTTTVRSIVKKLNPSDIDLIIGPVFKETFSIASGFARKNSIPIVSPLSSEDLPVKNNASIIQMNTQQQYRYESMANLITQQHNVNLIIVYNSKDLEGANVLAFKRVMNLQHATAMKTNNIVMTEVFFPQGGMAEVEKQMTAGKRNIVMVFSSNQAFVNNFVTKMYQFARRYDVQLIGQPQWERYENVELDFLFDMQFQFAATGYIDYSRDAVKSFVQKYRDTFGSEPTRFAFQGFDHVLYFVQALAHKNQSETLSDYVIRNPHQGLSENFLLKREIGSLGVVNTSVNIIQYTKNYEKIFVNVD